MAAWSCGLRCSSLHHNRNPFYRRGKRGNFTTNFLTLPIFSAVLSERDWNWNIIAVEIGWWNIWKSNLPTTSIIIISRFYRSTFTKSRCKHFESFKSQHIFHLENMLLKHWWNVPWHNEIKAETCLAFSRWEQKWKTFLCIFNKLSEGRRETSWINWTTERGRTCSNIMLHKKYIIKMRSLILIWIYKIQTSFLYPASIFHSSPRFSVLLAFFQTICSRAKQRNNEKWHFHRKASFLIKTFIINFTCMRVA